MPRPAAAGPVAPRGPSGGRAGQPAPPPRPRTLVAARLRAVGDAPRARGPGGASDQRFHARLARPSARGAAPGAAPLPDELVIAAGRGGQGGGPDGILEL